MAGIADAARQKQAAAMKSNYGFTDKQVKQYFSKEAALNTQTQADLTVLRKRLVATRDKDMRRKIAVQMRGTNAALTSKYKDALLSVATPAQRQKIMASF